MKKKRSKRAIKADRKRVSETQATELYYIVQHHTPRADVPERGLQKGTTKKLRAIIAEMKAGNKHKVIWRDELMAELDKRGLIYKD